MAINQESIQKLKALSLIDVVQEHVDLKKSGAHFSGLCPFHDENSPSFTVKEDHFHCYGCNAHGGDAIDFIQKKESLGFREACEYLASRFGITIERTENPIKQPPFLQALEFTDKLYQYVLLHTPDGHKAFEYLKKRGFNLDDVARFGIGLVPPPEVFWATYNEKYRAIKPRDIGVLVQAFEGRISFPVRNPSGKTIGFSCRKWNEDKEGAKYVNSTETDLFKKSLILYGLDISRKRIAKEGIAILCEGQTDVIRLAKEGLGLAVASLGTAFSNEYALSLSRAGAKKVYIAFDGDEAGRNSVVKVGSILQDCDIEPLVVEMPDSEDCDSFILKNDVERFRDRLSEASCFISFLSRHYLKECGDTPTGKSRACKECVKIIDSWTNPIVVRESKRKLAIALGVEEVDVLAISVIKECKSSLKLDKALGAEKIALCSILSFWGKTILIHSLVKDDFTTPLCRRLFSLLKANFKKTSDELTPLLHLEGLQDYYFKCLNFASLDKVRDSKKVLNALKREVAVNRIKQLQHELKSAIALGNPTTNITTEIKAFENKLKKLGIFD